MKTNIKIYTITINRLVKRGFSCMSINWSDLRPLNGSQRIAFEELCSQLARYESIPKNSLFIRKGSPDAGVECYWKRYQMVMKVDGR